MGKKYIITEQQEELLGNSNLLSLKKIVGSLKNDDLWNTIIKSYDKDLTKFVSKVVSEIPSLKGQEKKLLGNVLKVDSNPVSYINQIFKGSKLNEQQDPIITSLDVLLTATYIWIAYAMAALIFYPNVPYTKEQFRDLKYKIQKNKEGREAAKRYKEWQQWINSDEYKKQQQEIYNQKMIELENQEKLRLEKEKQMREESANKANEIGKEIENLKSSGAPLSAIKKLERNMTLYQRNSYPKDSQEWTLLNNKMEKIQTELDSAVETERLELIKQRELEKQKQLELQKKRAEEEAKKKELELQRLEILNAPLKKFQGKTVNIYNDRAQQILYGKDTIRSMEFDDTSKIGSRSGIYVYTEQGLEYEIMCLANPDRLADYLVLHDDIKILKYNAGFVNAVKQSSPNFCKKPKADFSMVRKPNQTKKMA